MKNVFVHRTLSLHLENSLLKFRANTLQNLLQVRGLLKTSSSFPKLNPNLGFLCIDPSGENRLVEDPLHSLMRMM